MKKFAVGYIDFFDNELTIEVVEANDWYDAFNSNCMIDIIEL